MVQVTLNSIVPSSVPTDGWKVRYRIKGTTGAYTTVGPFTSQPITFNTTDPGGTLYEGFILRDCGALESAEFGWVTPCVCADDYDIGAGGMNCQKVESQPPTTSSPGYCLAPSTASVYSSFGSRIYNPGFTLTDLLSNIGTSSAGIYGDLTSVQWSNSTLSNTLGPFNREGIWIDSDCDGSKDPLATGTSTTIAALYNNPGAPRTIYVGCAADNQFALIVNGSTIIDTGSSANDKQFKIWHIIPVNIVTGLNYFNLVAVGDGSVSDAMAMVVYDNTAPQIALAASDAQLNIIFASNTLRGTTYEIATCDPGWTLDTSGGAGNYVCRRTLVAICNAAE